MNQVYGINLRVCVLIGRPGSMTKLLRGLAERAERRKPHLLVFDFSLVAQNPRHPQRPSNFKPLESRPLRSHFGRGLDCEGDRERGED
jgi:hypothetical protein